MLTIKSYPSNIFWSKDSNRNTRKSCEICLKLTKKTPERFRWRFGVVIVHLSSKFPPGGGGGKWEILLGEKFLIGRWESKDTAQKWTFLLRISSFFVQWEEWFGSFEPLPRLKTTFCKNLTLIKIKISMACMCKQYEVKIKMVQEQWLLLKMTFLLVIGL